MTRFYCLAVLAMVLAPAAHAQRPQDCFPVRLDVPDPFPNPYPPEEHAGPGVATGCAADYRSQPWDGTAWGPDDQTRTATYDAAGRQLTVTLANVGAGLAPDARDTYAYDGAGRLTSALYERTVSGVLQPSSRLTLAYDGAGRLSSYVSETAAGGGWVPRFRTTLSFGSGSYRTASFTEVWSGGAWAPNNRSTFTYTASGQKATSLYEVFAGTAWVNSESHQYTYDGAGRLASYVLDLFNAQYPRRRFLHAYDSTGLLNELRFQEQPGAEWKDTAVYTYAYTSGLLSEVVSLAANAAGSLEPSARSRYAYAGGHLAESATDSRLGSAWQTDARTLYTRGADARPTEILSQTREAGGTALVNARRERLAYDGNVSAEGGPDAEALALSVGPNPARGAAAVRFALAEAATVRLVVTDALGRDVLTAEHALGAGVQALALDTARLAPGLYVVRLRAGALAATRRLVVAR